MFGFPLMRGFLDGATLDSATAAARRQLDGMPPEARVTVRTVDQNGFLHELWEAMKAGIPQILDIRTLGLSERGNG